MEKQELTSKIRQVVEELNSLINLANPLNIKVFIHQSNFNISKNDILNNEVSVSLSITETL